MSFGENLRLMRKARNLTQEQFAEALGVSRQAVSKWEADSGYPEAEKLIAISRVLGVSADKLLDIEPEQDQTENEDSSAEQDQLADTAGGAIAIMTFDKENMVRCQSVRSSQVVGNGKGPKYVLLGIKGSGLLGEKTEILGWYADKEQIRREIESIRLAMSRGERTYQLQFYTKVEYRGVLGQPHIVE